jgi:multidrug resistance efflux pump
MSSIKVVHLLFTTRAVLIAAVASTLGAYVYRGFLDDSSTAAVLCSQQTVVLSPVSGEVAQGEHAALASRIEPGQRVFRIRDAVEEPRLATAFQGAPAGGGRDDAPQPGVDVVVPTSGKVVGVFATPGTRVNRGDRLLSYSSCSDFYVSAYVSRRIYDRLSRAAGAQPASVRIAGESYPARVVSIAPAFAGDQGLFPPEPGAAASPGDAASTDAHVVLAIGGDVQRLTQRCPIGIAATAYF